MRSRRYGIYVDQFEAYPGSYPPAGSPTAGPAERLIDLSAPRRAPVERLRPGQIRKAALAFTALAVMAAGGAGYVLLRRTDPDNSAAASVRQSPEVPAPPSAEPGDSTVPNGEPIHAAPASHAGASAPTTSSPAAVPTLISVVPVPVIAQPVRTSAPVKSSAPASASAPAAPAPTGGSASVSAPATVLTATYSYRTDDEDADPITGYVGTIRVANPGDAAAGSWTVRLTVPSGNTVSVETGDVTVSREGDRAAFHPTAPTIAAHGSVTFTFALSNPVNTVPTACTVNDADCG